VRLRREAHESQANCDRDFFVLFSMVSIMEPLGLLLLSAIWLLPSVSAFYLPGVAPQDFAKVQFDFHAFCCYFCAFFGFPHYFFVLFSLLFVFVVLYFRGLMTHWRLSFPPEPEHIRFGLRWEGLIRKCQIYISRFSNFQIV
jgi:hypothetical protein